MDEENGVFSKPFITAFHPFLSDLGHKYRALTMVTYRECSEFVHGNPIRTRPLEGELEFREELLRYWSDTIESIRLVTVYLYLCRHIETVEAEKREHLEKLAADNLWHEEQVRACFEGN